MRGRCFLKLVGLSHLILQEHEDLAFCRVASAGFACFLLHAPESNVTQWQPPFLRHGKCFLELVTSFLPVQKGSGSLPFLGVGDAF